MRCRESLKKAERILEALTGFNFTQDEIYKDANVDVKLTDEKPLFNDFRKDAIYAYVKSSSNVIHVVNPLACEEVSTIGHELLHILQNLYGKFFLLERYGVLEQLQSEVQQYLATDTIKQYLSEVEAYWYTFSAQDTLLHKLIPGWLIKLGWKQSLKLAKWEISLWSLGPKTYTAAIQRGYMLYKWKKLPIKEILKSL